MFTFSFGSAFATVSWTGEATSKYLNGSGRTTIMISPMYDAGYCYKRCRRYYRSLQSRASLQTAKAELKFVKGSNTPFYAPEKAEAVAAIEAYIEALKTVKTAS